MALGGGCWQAQNKVLPGTYINFTSLAKASAALSARGVAAAPFSLSWGPEGTVFAVTAAEFRKDCKRTFGYDVNAPEMLALRETFCNATKVYCYRLGAGETAANTYAEAKYPGKRGNDITICVADDVDNAGSFVVRTVLDGEVVDEQCVKSAAELGEKEYVKFKSSGVTLSATAGTPLTGGKDCASVTGNHYQAFLDAIESYSFNTLCCPAKPLDAEDLDSAVDVTALFVQFTKRMREENGAKFQLCAIKPAANTEGVIGVWNDAKTQDGTDTEALVYWVAGAQAAVGVDKSLTNAKYTGELVVDTAYTQAELESAISAGKFMLHNVNGDARVLEDINTLVTLTAEKGSVFQSNQTVRVCDQIANDTAVLFGTKYIGAVLNNASGRAALWNDVVTIIRQLVTVGVVEDFNPEIVTVGLGDSKGAVSLSVDGLSIAGAMDKLYMSVIIR